MSGIGYERHKDNSFNKPEQAKFASLVNLPLLGGLLGKMGQLCFNAVGQQEVQRKAGQTGQSVICDANHPAM